MTMTIVFRCDRCHAERECRDEPVIESVAFLMASASISSHLTTRNAHWERGDWAGMDYCEWQAYERACEWIRAGGMLRSEMQRLASLVLAPRPIGPLPLRERERIPK